MITIGSLFSGIGGFELGAKWAFDDAGIKHKVLWQCEQDKFCQKILKKHWPNIHIYDDITTINTKQLPHVDILMGGFPCQDISIAGHMRGINAKRSGLFWEMYKIICDIRPQIVVLENVANFTICGLPAVLGAFAKIGYDAEWTTISAKQFGAPHVRKRVFVVCYIADANSKRPQKEKNVRNAHGKHNKASLFKIRNEQAKPGHVSANNDAKPPNWHLEAPTSIYRVDDGICRKLYRTNNKRLKSLGNAIVPQCSKWVFDQIIQSGLL